jgi:hypothetical protein
MTTPSMRPCVFAFDDEQEFPGFAHGTTWNGFDNVSVEPQVRDAIVAHFRESDCHPDTEAANLDILALPTVDGLVSLANGYATQIIRDHIVFYVGQRVRLRHDIAPFPIGVFEKGACGTVIEVDDNANVGDPIADVRMDDHFESLDHWDNVLQVCRYDDEVGEVTEHVFEAIDVGFV